MTILIMTCSNSAKWLTFMTCSKSAKWQLCFLTSSKLAKWLIIMTSSKLAVFNKAIQGTFFKSQKSKNRHKSYLLWEAVANRAIHGTFLSLKKVKKRVYGNYGSIFACDLEKCPGSLYWPLLGYPSPLYVCDFIDWYPPRFDFARLPYFPHIVLLQNFIRPRFY